jgi:hypothetical protein
MLRRCKGQDFQLFVSIARKIWKRRTDFIHEGMFLHPNADEEDEEEDEQLEDEDYGDDVLVEPISTTPFITPGSMTGAENSEGRQYCNGAQFPVLDILVAALRKYCYLLSPSPHFFLLQLQCFRLLFFFLRWHGWR